MFARCLILGFFPSTCPVFFRLPISSFFKTPTRVQQAQMLVLFRVPFFGRVKGKPKRITNCEWGGVWLWGLWQIHTVSASPQGALQMASVTARHLPASVV